MSELSTAEIVEQAVERCLAMYERVAGTTGSDRIGMIRAIDEDPKALTREQQVQFIIAALRHPRLGPDMHGPQHGESRVDSAAYLLEAVCEKLLTKKLPLTAVDARAILETAFTRRTWFSSYACETRSLVAQLGRWHTELIEDEELQDGLRRLAEGLERRKSDGQELARRVRKLLPTDLKLPMEPGEAWSDAAIAYLSPLDESVRVTWIQLLRHCIDAPGGKPTKKWSSAAREMVSKLGVDEVRRCLFTWFPLVDEPRTIPKGQNDAWRTFYDQHIEVPHSDMLRGLCWIAAWTESAEMARTLTALAISCYRKPPGETARLIGLGNAAVYALGAMPGTAAIGQLSRLRTKVKFGTAQAMIGRALDRAAEREGMPRSEIEEMAVPSYGLEAVGVLREELGDCEAQIRVGHTLSASLHWTNSKGKTVKSIPANVKRDHADPVKELKAALKDIQVMLPSQRLRIERGFLERRRWSVDVWRERYLDHPLVGVIARRLIWIFDDGKQRVAAAWLRGDADEPPHADGELVRADGRPFEPAEGSLVTLWHPIEGDEVGAESAVRDDVAAWRQFYESNQICQPFKQAHREVYLLTDAERQTGVYSNRFAAHAVEQYQFNALARERGWKLSLQMAISGDEGVPARRDLNEWNLRVEFWISGLGDARDPEMVVGSGSYRFLATDQVRFYSADQRLQDDDPIPIEQIPPNVLSECLRDADLFVGVASVGNNPEWSDGGPEGRFRDYWSAYSFGELAESAKTRHGILSRLTSRLEIADACELDDRFLIVRGTKRTYKIHLGSGNILMEPDDQYLCIVQGRTESGRGVFLPFEGDRTLALILSKAFLLAADDKITDKTILSQIGRYRTP